MAEVRDPHLPMQRVRTVAGVIDREFDPASLSDERRRERRLAIGRIVAELEEGRCIRLSDAQRGAIVRWLDRQAATIRQIAAAAELISASETYRSIATDVWARAMGSATVSLVESARREQAAYTRGRLDERRASSGAGQMMSDETRTALEHELRIARMSEELDECRRQLRDAERTISELVADNSRLEEKIEVLMRDQESPESTVQGRDGGCRSAVEGC